MWSGGVGDKHPTKSAFVSIQPSKDPKTLYLFPIHPPDLSEKHVVEPLIADSLLGEYFDRPFSLPDSPMVGQGIEFRLLTPLPCTLVSGQHHSRDRCRGR